MWAAYLDTRIDIGESTVVIIGDTLTNLVKCLKDIECGKVTVDDAERFKAWMHKEQGFAPATIHRHLRTARAVYTHAIRRKIVDFNPFEDVKMRVPKPDNDWAYISTDQLHVILRHAPSQQWWMMLALCRLAGLRRGEAIRLKWADIDTNKGIMAVKPQHHHQTTKQRRRLVPIVPDLARLINKAVRADGRYGPCDGMPLCNLERTLLHILENAGVEKYAKPFHTLRKNCESDWLSQFPVMDVCAWLGHSPAVAMVHYHRTTEATFALASGRGAVQGQ